MNKVTVFASTVLLATNMAWAEDMQEQAAFPFSFSPMAKGQVTVSLDKGKVSAKLPNGKVQALGEMDDSLQPSAEAGSPHFAVAQVADFNFDGSQDVGILDGNGYGGVNLFYRVYLWDKASASFKAFAETVSNPVLDAKKKTLTSSERSGPRWFSTEYQADKGKLYVAMESEMLALGDTVLDYLTFKNAAGKVTGHKIAGEATGDAPVTAKIQAAKAWLYDKPSAGSKTKMYVIKGDAVTLLDWKAKPDDAMGDNGWFLIRYKGSKVIEKWIDSRVLVKG